MTLWENIIQRDKVARSDKLVKTEFKWLKRQIVEALNPVCENCGNLETVKVACGHGFFCYDCRCTLNNTCKGCCDICI